MLECLNIHLVLNVRFVLDHLLCLDGKLELKEDLKIQ